MSTIPPNAKRVFKGEIFEVYQWQQKMFDGSTGTFEMLRRADTVQILALKNDKILITREEQPHRIRQPGLLGGRVDEGETPLEAAKRELLEESGLGTDDWELWKSYSPSARMDWTIYFYIARNCQKVAEPHLESGEKIEIQEVAFEEFIDLFSKDTFWGEFGNDLLRMKLVGRLDEFKKKLFL